MNDSKIGRNAPCPCGSGKKYKRCHGMLDTGNPSIQDVQRAVFGSLSVSHAPRTIPSQVLQMQRVRELERQMSLVNHGDVRPVITAEVNGWRFVASGKKLHYSDKWRSFHDFLGGYIAGCLGKEWGERQVRLPVEEQHPVAQWHTYLALSQQRTRPDESGWYVSSVGAANAWGRLAYDVYLIEHNAALQKRLIRRLRDPLSFQGARFEAAVAAMMLASGYDLAFADEKGPGKHPEFHATQRETGIVLAVEAKSRHRAGIMGHKPREMPALPESYGIDKLLLDAVEKDTEHPLLVFIELNVPWYGDLSNPAALTQELEQSWRRVQQRKWPNGFPCVGVVFYNDVAPWFLREPLRDGECHIWAAVYWPESSRHAFDPKPLLTRVAQGCIQRSNMPRGFPGASVGVLP